ncbi:Putative uncharacterized protein [Lacticaseibacillus paracasei]|nr:Putative uncharacterized protein [Lacticaseibacillus paracasei]
MNSLLAAMALAAAQHG